ncbi:unnamed protein product, partial [Amoebophrya sp. A120]|eukprot:GSA120T00018102001.1
MTAMGDSYSTTPMGMMLTVLKTTRSAWISWSQPLLTKSSCPFPKPRLRTRIQC